MVKTWVPTHVQYDVELAAPSLMKSAIKSVFVSILLFHGNVIEIIMYLDRGTWYGMIGMVTLPMHIRFNWPRQLTTLTIRPHRAQASCWWVAQDCSDSSALAMELLQSCTKPTMSSGARWFVKWSEGSDEKQIFSEVIGDKYEKHCYTLNGFICVCIFEKWLNGKGWYYYKLHFMLSCIIWIKKQTKKQYVQRTHGTKLITGLNNYCMLYRPMLLVLKTVNPLLSLSKRSYFTGQIWWKNIVLPI